MLDAVAFTECMIQDYPPTSLRCLVWSQDGKHGDASGIFTWKGRYSTL